jgi:hypothetical protein
MVTKMSDNRKKNTLYVVADGNRAITAKLDLVDITKKGHGAAVFKDPELALIAALQAVAKHTDDDFYPAVHSIDKTERSEALVATAPLEIMSKMWSDNITKLDSNKKFPLQAIKNILQELDLLVVGQEKEAVAVDIDHGFAP